MLLFQIKYEVKLAKFALFVYTVQVKIWIVIPVVHIVDLIWFYC